MKISGLKSTRSCRESVTVVDPHSMSIRPLVTASMRSATVTGAQRTFSWGRLSASWTSVTIRVHRSMEYPVGFPSLPTKENGAEFSRYPRTMVPAVFIFLSVPCSS